MNIKIRLTRMCGFYNVNLKMYTQTSKLMKQNIRENSLPLFIVYTPVLNASFEQTNSTMGFIFISLSDCFGKLDA